MNGRLDVTQILISLQCIPLPSSTKRILCNNFKNNKALTVTQSNLPSNRPQYASYQSLSVTFNSLIPTFKSYLSFSKLTNFLKFNKSEFISNPTNVKYKLSKKITILKLAHLFQPNTSAISNSDCFSI